MCFSPKLVPAATRGVWGRLPTLQLLWGLNENQMGNLSVRACSTPIPSLISTVLRTALYNWKAPGKFCTVSDEDKVGAWKRGEQHPVTPRSKEVRTQRGSCPAGEGSCLEWPRSLSIATQWASLFSNRRSPSLLLHSRAPWGIRLRLWLLLKCQLCLSPTPPLYLCQFFDLETSLWQSLALRSLAWSIFLLTPL